MDIFSRIRRFMKRSVSLEDTLSKLIEEGKVRLWSHVVVRRLVTPILSTKEPEKWVFVTGCFNSGTTLLQKLITAHPDVSGLPREGVRFTNVLSNLETNGHHMMWDDDYRSIAAPKGDVSKNYSQIARDWSPFFSRRKSVYMDKSVANAARIPWLDTAFKNAHFIGIHRNGFCVAEGLRRRAVPPQWLQEKSGQDTYSVSAVANQWISANTDLLNGLKCVSHGQLVGFETLLSSPVETMGKIFSELGLPPCDIRKHAGGIDINGQFFELLDPNPASLARLEEEEKFELTPLLSATMKRLGYDD